MPAKMRTLPKAIEEIKQLDPDTALTLSTLRLLVKRGELPVVHIRNRQLIDMDVLTAYLKGTYPKGTNSGSAANSQTIAIFPEQGQIRRLSER